MQDNQYITNRLLPEIIKRICAEKHILVTSFSDDWMLTLNKNQTKQIIYGFKFGGLNDSAAVATSQDKVATYELLQHAGIKAVPHVLISTRAGFYDEWTRQAEKWGKFVIKPTYGAGGRAIYAFNDVFKAKQLMDTHFEQSWCASPLVAIKSEVRLILLRHGVILAFEKKHPSTVHGVPMHNLRLGAMAMNIEPNEELVAIATAAQRALALNLAAIDIVTLQTGEQLVLEVNEGFSLEHYMRQSDENKKCAEDVYRKIIDATMTL